MLTSYIQKKKSIKANNRAEWYVNPFTFTNVYSCE